MKMSFRALLAAGSLLLLGVTLGVGGDRLWLSHHQSGRGGGPGVGGGVTTQVVLDTEHAARFRAMLDDMDLSDTQRAAVDSVLGHYQGNVEHTWNAMQPILQSTMDSARRAIIDLFTEEQRATFQEWLAAEHQRMHSARHTFPH